MITTNSATEFATTACRDFIRAGGTLQEWRLIYNNAACQLSDDDLALSKRNAEQHEKDMREAQELITKMEIELAQLTGQPKSKK